MRSIRAEDLKDLATGAAVLGTGGGGDPYIGSLMAREAIQKRGPVTLIDVDELPDEALVVPAAMMGAPTVMVEKLPQGDELTVAFKKLETFLGRKIDAVLCAEAGGLNSTTPVIVAAETGLPLVDGDGMGRAFPELQMASFTLHGVHATPMVMTDDKGNSVVLNTVDNRWTERLARAATIEMGGSALIALYAMDGATAKRAVIRGTVAQAIGIGRALREAHSLNQDGVAAVRDHMQAFHLLNGKIVDVSRRTVGGFARGKAVLEGLDDFAGQHLTIEFQNEFLVARTPNEVLASTPDLITVLDMDEGSPITTESLRFGFRVAVLGIPCDPQWRTAAGLELVGPRYFGYDIPFVPVETLSATARS